MASEESVRYVLDQYKTDLSSVNEVSCASQEESLSEAGNIKNDCPRFTDITSVIDNFEYAVKSHAIDAY